VIRIVLVALLTVLVPQAASAQASQISVSGQVVGTDTGQPLRAASVSGPSGSTRTDDSGQFTVSVPVSGTAPITISKAGYLTQTVSIAGAAAGSASLNVRLSRGGGITVRVVDAYGEPRVDARVSVFPLAPEPGTVNRALGTDDRGEARRGGLKPGRYTALVTPDVPMVAAQLPPGTTFQPGQSPLPPGTVFRPAGGPVRLPQTVVILREDEELTVSLVDPSPPRTMLASGASLALPPGLTPLPPGTGVIRGRVLRSDGQPLARARINATTPDSIVPLTTEANADGGYELRSVPSGTWSITAGAPGMSSVGPSGLPDSRMVTIREGQTRTIPDLTVWRGSAISGTVLNAEGDPVAGLAVEVWRVTTDRTGASSLLPLRNANHHTDERGRYRMFGLPAGKYYVNAANQPPSSQEMRVYHPGSVILREAAVVTVGAERETTGIDIRYIARPAHRLRGTVRTASGDVATGSVMLMSRRTEGAMPTAVMNPGSIRPDGTFEIGTPLNPGEYVARASVNAPGGSVEIGSVNVSITADPPQPVSIVTSAAVPLRGRIEFDGDITGLQPSQFRLWVERLDETAGPSSTTPARINDDWTFDAGAATGLRRLSLRFAPSNWWLASVTVDGRKPSAGTTVDTSELDPANFVIVRLSNSGAEITGQVTDRGRVLGGDFVVAAFSTDESQWYEGAARTRIALPDQTGRFTVTKLPPGDYFIVAVDAFAAQSSSEWQSADLLQRLSRSAATISVPEAQRLTITLPLTTAATR